MTNTFTAYLQEGNYAAKTGISLLLLLFTLLRVAGQTPTDGLMMSKGNLCSVALYTHDSWDHYWEGTLRRDNPNIGTITTQSFRIMGAVGLSNRFNLIVDVPYVWTAASAGTLRSMKGMQEISLALKWQTYTATVPFGKFSAFTVAGFSTPMHNYVKDLLPVSIGLGSTTGSVRGVLHYKTKIGAFITAQAGYTHRRNIRIDRNAYFTDRMVYSNEVFMPDVVDGSVRAGYLDRYFQAEMILSRFTTLSGFDITRNNMPFPSNLVQATRLGVNTVFRPAFMKNFSVNAGVSLATHGRNTGQSVMYYGGLQYVLHLWGNVHCEAPKTITTPQN